MTATKPRILCVDDESEILKFLEAVLVPKGYEVIKAENGEEALEKLKEERVDLVISDVRMPQMGGPQLVDQLRQVRQDFKALYISGYTDNSITHRGVLEKAMNYIQKPFTVDGLARKVREVLDK